MFSLFPPTEVLQKNLQIMWGLLRFNAFEDKTFNIIFKYDEFGFTLNCVYVFKINPFTSQEIQWIQINDIFRLRGVW